MDTNTIIMYMALGWMLGTVSYAIGIKLGEYKARRRNTN